MPRKSSTNTRALSTRLQHLSLQVRPVVKVGPCRSQPKARAPASSVWVSRTARCYGSVPAGTNSFGLSYGRLADALGLESGESVSVRVTGLKVWNMTPPGQNSQYVKLGAYGVLMDDNVSVVTVEDIGTATSLPGVFVDIPDAHTTSQNVLFGSTNQFATVEVSNSDLSATAAVQKLVFDVFCLVKQ